MPGEVTRCLQELQSVLGSGQLNFREQSLARGGRRYDLAGPGAVPAQAGNRDYGALPLEIEVQSSVKYWFAVCLTFASELGELAFDTVSLIVFQGTLAHETKSPVLRAEWEARPHESSPHAQPHWHVYNAAALVPVVYRVQQVQSDGEFAVLDDPIQELGPSGAPSGTDHHETRRIHLAMAAQWHLHANHISCEAPTADHVATWLAGCVAYTRRQLAYLVKHATAPRPI